jgi:hypothetical protein
MSCSRPRRSEPSQSRRATAWAGAYDPDVIEEVTLAVAIEIVANRRNAAEIRFGKTQVGRANRDAPAIFAAGAGRNFASAKERSRSARVGFIVARRSIQAMRILRAARIKVCFAALPTGFDGQTEEARIEQSPMKIGVFVDLSWRRRAGFIFLHAMRRKGVDSPERQRL